MTAGADSIDDMGVLRHGAAGTLFAGVRAPSTLGSFIRSFTWGNVRQAEKAGREFLARLAGQAPLLPGADVLAFVDIDSTQKRVYGHQKQGARFGHPKVHGKSLLVRGLNALAATVSTPLAAPAIAGTRLRGGNAGSARGAAGFAAEAIGTARACGATGTIVTRMDSAYYGAEVIAAIRRAGAFFSVTIPGSAAVRAAIAAISEDAWTPVRYPSAIWDEQLNCWISDAEVAETEYTAFTSKKKSLHVTARLLVRRVRALNPQAAYGQDELFTAWRHHAVFTDSPFELVQAEDQHRGHAIVEQVFADLNDGPLAHMPSGRFNANAAWLAIAAMAFNLLRAAGALASRTLARARSTTIRRDLVSIAARIARHGRGRVTLHLPRDWHREHERLSLLEACGPPAHAA
jgi:Transposase DDE domain group 1